MPITRIVPNRMRMTVCIIQIMRPQPNVIDYYIMDNGKSGVFITEIKVPLDAVEGHGARLHQSINTFKIFEN